MTMGLIQYMKKISKHFRCPGNKGYIATPKAKRKRDKHLF